MCNVHVINFTGNCQLIILAALYESSSCSIFLRVLDVFSVPFSSSGGHLVIFHCNFILHILYPLIFISMLQLISNHPLTLARADLTIQSPLCQDYLCYNDISTSPLPPTNMDFSSHKSLTEFVHGVTPCILD